MKRYILFFAFLSLSSCLKKNKTNVDMIITDATIYKVDKSFDTATAMAITGGKIIAVGTDSEITAEYKSDNKVDADGKFIYPGLIDAHCHFYGYGLSLQEVDLRGTKSMEEIVSRIQKFQKVKKLDSL
jgi:predicted amidohydrolase YtcJ